MKTKEQILQRQQEIVNLAKVQGRDLTAEEQAEFDGLQKDLDGLVVPEASAALGQRGIVPTQPEAPPAMSVTPEQAAQRAIEMERQRTAEVTNLCRGFGIDPAQYITDGSSVDAVRAAVIDHLQRTSGPISMRVTADEGDKYRDGAADALVLRAGLPVERPAAGAAELRGMSLRDIGIECLAREGESMSALLRMDATDLYNNLCRQFYNPTAAFPAILDNTIRKSIVHLYNSVPTTFETWTSRGSLNDFKETKDHEYLIGGAGDFLIVPENGELKQDTPSTHLLPTRRLDTYGRQFSMSRQAFINDDIGFLTEIPGLYATRAKKTIDKQVYAILFNGGKVINGKAQIFDGKPLFGADHKNVLGAGSKPTQSSIQSMILLMQGQTDPFDEPIYMSPRHLIVGTGYEFDLAVIFRSAQVVGSGDNDINPLYNYPLSVVQTPMLNALAKGGDVPWFVTAHPTSAKGIQVDYLNGQSTPTTRRMEQAGVLGFTWDIYLDWGISVRDWRGIYKNPGAPIVPQ